MSSVAIGEDIMSRATPCSSPMITDIADRSSLVRRSALLAWFAIGWNTIEGLVAIAATAGRRRRLTVTLSWAWGPAW